jgi:hypothetical protein
MFGTIVTFPLNGCSLSAILPTLLESNFCFSDLYYSIAGNLVGYDCDKNKGIHSTVLCV